MVELHILAETAEGDTARSVALAEGHPVEADMFGRIQRQVVGSADHHIGRLTGGGGEGHHVLVRSTVVSPNCHFRIAAGSDQEGGGTVHTAVRQSIQRIVDGGEIVPASTADMVNAVQDGVAAVGFGNDGVVFRLHILRAVGVAHTGGKFVRTCHRLEAAQLHNRRGVWGKVALPFDRILLDTVHVPVDGGGGEVALVIAHVGETHLGRKRLSDHRRGRQVDKLGQCGVNLLLLLRVGTDNGHARTRLALTVGGDCRQHRHEEAAIGGQFQVLVGILHDKLRIHKGRMLVETAGLPCGACHRTAGISGIGGRIDAVVVGDGIAGRSHVDGMGTGSGVHQDVVLDDHVITRTCSIDAPRCTGTGHADRVLEDVDVTVAHVHSIIGACGVAHQLVVGEVGGGGGTVISVIIDVGQIRTGDGSSPLVDTVAVAAWDVGIVAHESVPVGVGIGCTAQNAVMGEAVDFIVVEIGSIIPLVGDGVAVNHDVRVQHVAVAAIAVDAVISAVNQTVEDTEAVDHKTGCFVESIASRHAGTGNLRIGNNAAAVEFNILAHGLNVDHVVFGTIMEGEVVEAEIAHITKVQRTGQHHTVGIAA